MVVRRFVPSKGTKCHREITLEFLTPDKTYPENRRRTWRQSSPHSLLCPKWRASWFCIISMHWLGLVIVFSNKSFLFYYAALLTVHSFLTDGFTYSALEDSEIMGHIDTAINCSSYISTYISMYAWSCPFTGGYLQELLRLLTDIDYMQTNVFVKLTLSCNHIKKAGLTKYGDFPCLEQRRRIMTWNWILINEKFKHRLERSLYRGKAFIICAIWWVLGFQSTN